MLASLHKSVNLSLLLTRYLPSYNRSQQHPFSLSQIKIALLNNRSLLRQCIRCHQYQSQSQDLQQRSLSPLYNSQTHLYLNRSRLQRKACQTILQLLQEPICQEQPLSICRLTSQSLNRKLKAAYQLLEAVAVVASSVTCQVLAEKDKVVSAALEVSATAPVHSTSTTSTCKMRRKSSTN